jgi:predicted dehydrogenase
MIKLRGMLAKRSVAMIQAHYYMPGLPGPAWWPKMALGGGQLIEQTTHMLDLGRFLAGDVVSVSGRTATVRNWTDVPEGYVPDGLLKYSEIFEIPDTTALTMQYASGALGTVSCSIVPQATWDVGFKVVADGLLITIDGANATWSGDEQGSMSAGDDWPAYVLREFTDAVASGGTTSVPYEEGIKSLAVSIAGYESVRKGGCPVDLKDILPAGL